MRNPLRFIISLLVIAATLYWGSSVMYADNPPGKQVIVIDPGHGGIDGGTQAAGGALLEKTLNLEVAQRLKQALQAKGFVVYMTRETDIDCTQHAPNSNVSSRHRRDLMGRVQYAADQGASLVVSIHGNTGTATNRGPLVMYQPEMYESQYAAEIVQQHFNRLTGINQHIVKARRLYIMSHSKIPVILVEVGFLSNPRDVEALKTPDYQNKLAAALSAGISEYFLTKADPAPANP